MGLYILRSVKLTLICRCLCLKKRGQDCCGYSSNRILCRFKSLSSTSSATKKKGVVGLPAEKIF